MAIYTVDDCFHEIKNGANIKQGEIDGGYPITRIETLSDDKFNRNRMGYAGITDISKYSSYVLENGDLLMSHINSPKYLGRTVMYEKQNDEVIIHGMNLLRLRAKKNLLLPSYAEFLFRSRSVKEQITKIMKKSVNQASFSVSDLKKIKLSVPAIETQIGIVQQLRKVRAIIDLRLAQLEEHDNLVKARFVEMFGTFPANEKLWNIGTIRDVITEARYGSSRPAVAEGKYPYLRMNNITYTGELDLSDTKRIDVPENELPKCTVQRGDVLFNRTNSKELVGKTCVYNRDELMVLAGFVIRIRINNLMMPEFLSAFLNTDFSKQMLLGMCKAAIGQANINAQEMQNIGIYIPPIAIQKEFVAFKKQVDKSKVVVQKALDEGQMWFDSLIQEYFGEGII